MAKRLKAVITGASSGIGEATARRFAVEGVDVCLNARRAEKLESLVEELPAGDHFHCAGDYSDPATAELLVEMIGRKWGSLDILVNCAGVSGVADAMDSSLEEWRRPFDIMIDGAIQMTRAVVPLLNEGGRIIHVTSIHGERAEKGTSAYAMAKAALNQFCRALAVELAPKGILVNAIAPGFIRTPMSMVDGVSELETDWFKCNYVSGHHLPLRRPGEPEEVAGAAWFLAGKDATYITGQVLVVDGGLTITF